MLMQSCIFKQSKISIFYVLEAILIFFNWTVYLFRK